MNVEFLFTLLLFILGFGFLIFVHELGHFLVAKWVGVRCPQFAIGFGTAMLSWRRGIGFRTGSTEAEYQKRAAEGLRAKGKDPEEATPADHFAVADEMGLGETEYRLNYLPLGGYVKMIGQEDLDPAARSDDPRAFNKQPIWARTLIISAGVVMNIIFGWVFLVIAFIAGVQFPANVIGDVSSSAPAGSTYAQGHQGDPRYLGLQVGDVVTQLDGDPVKDWSDVIIATALGSPGATVEFTIERDGENEPLRYGLRPEANDGGLLAVGVAPAQTLELGEVSQENEGVAWLRDAGVRRGMRIVRVDEIQVATLGQMVRAVNQKGAGGVTLAFADDTGSVVEIPVDTQPGLERQPEEGASLMGLIPSATVVDLIDDAPAAQAGLKPGDVIIRADEVASPPLSQLPKLIGQAGADGVDLEVHRGDEVVRFEDLKPRDGQVGIYMSLGRPVIAGAVPESAAAAAGLDRAGAEILSVNGEKVATWGELQAKLQSLVAENGPNAEGATAVGTTRVTLAYRLLGVKESPTYEATLEIDAATAARIAAAGWSLDLGKNQLPLKEMMVRVSGDNIAEASRIGLEKTYEFVVQTYLTIVRLFQGSVGVSDLRGPVGIVDEGTRIAARGWPYMLFFLGLISVNLAVINFLPIPITDGGHILFLVVEKVKGSPVSPRIQTIATVVGLVLLGALVLTTTFHDVIRVFGNFF